MPFKSEAERGWMYANKPELAAKFEAETPKGTVLPAKVDPNNVSSLRERIKRTIMAKKMPK